MITLRPARLTDMPELIALLKTLFSIEKDFEFNESKQGAGLQQMLNNKQGQVFVAESNQHVIGMCSGQLTVSTAEGGPALLVEDVVVCQEWRTQGVGTLLMNELEKWALSKGVARLQLLADQTNDKALEFYQKTGWASTQLICLRKHLS